MTAIDVELEQSRSVRRWMPLAAICLGSAMLLIDVSIVNVALPQLARGLHASFSTLQWVVDAYAVALAALLLGVGATADLCGHRRTYLAGLGVFGVASLACGLAPSVVVLDVARAVQGAGAAAMLSCTMALLNSTYRDSARGVAFGWWGAVSGAATAVGPVLGGLLVQLASWRWIFIVNVPLTVIAITLTARFIPTPSSQTRRSPDVPGMVSFAAFAGALTYGLIRVGEHEARSVATWACFAVAVLSAGAFVGIERRRARSHSAMFDLGLLRHRMFAAAMLASTVVTLCAFAALTYSTIWLQTIVGLTPVEAGLTGLPLAAASFLVSIRVGPRLRLTAGRVISLGMLLTGLGSIIDVGLLTGPATWTALVPGTTVTGLGAGLVLPALTAAAMGAVPPQFGGMAAGALGTVRQLGFAIGIVAFGGLIALRAGAHLQSERAPRARALAQALVAGQGRIAEPGVSGHTMNSAMLDGLAAAFLAAGIVALAAAAAVHLLTRQPPRGLASPA